MTGKGFAGGWAVVAVVVAIACFSGNTTTFGCRIPIDGTKGHVGFTAPIDDATATTGSGIPCYGAVDEGEYTIYVTAAGGPIEVTEISDAAATAFAASARSGVT